MVDRRTFLHHATALLGAALPARYIQTPRRYAIGLQLFTLNGAMNQDPVGTLTRVKAMGYEEVETYGINPEAMTYYGLPAREFASRLKDHNLATPSGHYDFQNFLNGSDDQMNRYVDRCAEGARLLGQHYVVWPYLEPSMRTLDHYRRVAARLNVIGERVAKAGLRVAYHNGGGEFVDQGGQLGYDIILKETDPRLVALQIDLYWLSFDTTVLPRVWFERARGRFEMWHVKDMHKVNRRYTELGNGSIDYTKIWPDAVMSGMKHFFVEQGGNFTHDPIRSITDSAEYVKRVLLKESPTR